MMHDDVVIFYNRVDGNVGTARGSIKQLYSLPSAEEDAEEKSVWLPFPVDAAGLKLIFLRSKTENGELITKTFACIQGKTFAPSRSVITRLVNGTLHKHIVKINSSDNGVSLMVDYVDIVANRVTPAPSPNRVTSAVAMPPPATTPLSTQSSIRPNPSYGVSHGLHEHLDFDLADKVSVMAYLNKLTIMLNPVHGEQVEAIVSNHLGDVSGNTTLVDGSVNLTGERCNISQMVCDALDDNTYNLLDIVHYRGALWVIIALIQDADSKFIDDDDEDDGEEGLKTNFIAILFYEQRTRNTYSINGLPVITEFSEADLDIDSKVNRLAFDKWLGKITGGARVSLEWLPDSYEDRPRAPPLKRQKTDSSSGTTYKRNGFLTLGLEKFEGTKAELIGQVGWGQVFKIYTCQQSGTKAGISVCNSENFLKCTMKCYVPSKVWKIPANGYGDFAQAKVLAEASKAALLKAPIEIDDDEE